MKFKRIYLEKFLFYAVFVFYIWFLLDSILFKYVSPLELFSADRYFSRSVNFLPFNDTLSYLFNPGVSEGFAKLNFFGNILLLVPMGIYLQIMLRDKRVWKSLLIVFSISLIFEVFQYGFGIGASDVDDIILNSLGGLVGILIYRGLLRLTKSEKKVYSLVTWVSTATGMFVLFIVAALFIYN